ncbi:hypothetical protein [Saccharicrinis fermentans]|uniref:Uncharacterized protein n=1 Tax=Saccharicrinis fermentans DSM 9555 = JCM 21142 TaxID=869213 RepID=W7YDD7_9BACT|nr:hypothetical protein [Saccharicrinis fermentans]GAF02496.1 hypothetical protein JCM21142_31134 [Saccharicrinis fermentans DSM 9555 = JCM 21142]
MSNIINKAQDDAQNLTSSLDKLMQRTGLNEELINYLTIFTLVILAITLAKLAHFFAKNTWSMLLNG